MKDLLDMKDYYFLVFTTKKSDGKVDVELKLFHSLLCKYVR